jgi:hypothetical protein
MGSEGEASTEGQEQQEKPKTEAKEGQTGVSLQMICNMDIRLT